MGKGGQSRLTGSAYQAMDVFVLRDSLYRVGVWGRDGTPIFSESRLADCLQNWSILGSTISEHLYVFVVVFCFLGRPGITKNRLADDGKRI